MLWLNEKEKAALRNVLKARSAEMLAVPTMVCRNRGCARRAACRMRWKSGEPACLADLTPQQRAILDALVDEADGAHERLAFYIMRPLCPRQPWRELEEAANEIAATLLSTTPTRRRRRLRQCLRAEANKVEALNLTGEAAARAGGRDE